MWGLVCHISPGAMGQDSKALSGRLHSRADRNHHDHAYKNTANSLGLQHRGFSS